MFLKRQESPTLLFHLPLMPKTKGRSLNKFLLFLRQRRWPLFFGILVVGFATAMSLWVGQSGRTIQTSISSGSLEGPSPCFTFFGITVGAGCGDPINDNLNAGPICLPSAECQFSVAPTATFAAGQTAPNFFVQFDSNVQATNDKCFGTPVYTWDFRDGNTSTRSSPSHTYVTPGTYRPLFSVNWGGACQSDLPTEPRRIDVLAANTNQNNSNSPLVDGSIQQLFSSSNSLEVGWFFNRQDQISSYTVKWGRPLSSSGTAETRCTYGDEGWPNKTIELDARLRSFVFNKDGTALLNPDTEYCVLVTAKRFDGNNTKSDRQIFRTTRHLGFSPDLQLQQGGAVKFNWGDPGVSTVPSTFNHYKVCYGDTLSQAETCEQSTGPAYVCPDSNKSMKDKSLRTCVVTGLPAGKQITAILKIIDNTGADHPDSILGVSDPVTPVVPAQSPLCNFTIQSFGADKTSATTNEDITFSLDLDKTGNATCAGDPQFTANFGDTQGQFSAQTPGDETVTCKKNDNCYTFKHRYSSQGNYSTIFQAKWGDNPQFRATNPVSVTVTAGGGAQASITNLFLEGLNQDKISQGANLTIKWTQANIPANSRIQISLFKTGQQPQKLGVFETNTQNGERSVVRTIPNVSVGPGYLIRVALCENDNQDPCNITGVSVTSASFEITTGSSTPSITNLVLTGLNQDKIAQGASLNIKWTQANIPANSRIVILLFKNGQAAQRLGAYDTNVQNSERTVDRVIPNVTPGPGYLIRVALCQVDSQVDPCAITGVSVTSASFEITSGSGGATPSVTSAKIVELEGAASRILKNGNSYTLSWTQQNTPQGKKLQIQLFSGNTRSTPLRTVSDTSNGAKKEVITMPELTGQNYKIVIGLCQNDPAQGFCDFQSGVISETTPFTIASSGAFPVAITVLRPDGGESFKSGDTTTIAWNPAHLTKPKIRVVLLKNDVAVSTPLAIFDRLVSNVDVREKSVTFPAAETSGNVYKVQVENCEADGTGVKNCTPTDRSDTTFSITTDGGSSCPTLGDVDCQNGFKINDLTTVMQFLADKTVPANATNIKNGDVKNDANPPQLNCNTANRDQTKIDITDIQFMAFFLLNNSWPNGQTCS